MKLQDNRPHDFRRCRHAAHASCARRLLHPGAARNASRSDNGAAVRIAGSGIILTPLLGTKSLHSESFNKESTSTYRFWAVVEVMVKAVRLYRVVLVDSINSTVEVDGEQHC